MKYGCIENLKTFRHVLDFKVRLTEIIISIINQIYNYQNDPKTPLKTLI